MAEQESKSMSSKQASGWAEQQEIKQEASNWVAEQESVTEWERQKD